MSNLSEYFLGSSANVVQYELVDFVHDSFTKAYYIVRNNSDGLTVTLENGEQRKYEYYPLRINPTNISTDLDYGVSVTLGDLGDIVPMEMENVAKSEYSHIKPNIIYRTYRSDDLSRPIFGPVKLEVNTITSNHEGSVIEAAAPVISTLRTGERYSITNFPSLRGFL